MVLQLLVSEVTIKGFRIFNFCFMILGTIFVMLSPKLPVSLMMNFTGAVVAYCIIYLFPTMIVYRTLYSPYNSEQISAID